jgi:hypothetical protein
VYEQGVAQSQRVHLLRPQQTTHKAAQASARSIDNKNDCMMELRCGYVNGDLSNCIYVAHCVAGSDGGVEGGWSGDNAGWGSGGSMPTQPTQTNTIDHSKLKPCQTQVLQDLQIASGTALLGIVKLFSGAEPGYN